jgi:metal-dependent amidase/aminoacylase/carboxypeptidase family protein
VRSPRQPSLEKLKSRVTACLQAGADAADCQLDVQWLDPAYLEMRDNGPLVERYVANAARVGRDVVDPDVVGAAVVGSTDMGNVSHLVPSIHPMIQVAPAHVAIHTSEFAQWAVAPEGDRAALDGAKVMAMTAADFWLRPELRAAVAAAFSSS